MPTDLVIGASATSGTSDGLTFTANPAVMSVGGAVGANGSHALLRFDTSTIAANDFVVRSQIAVTSNAIQTPTGTFNLWAARFGAAVGVPDYGGNTSLPSETGDTFRQLINRIIAAVALTNGQDILLSIPSHMVRRGVGNFTDVQIRPSVSGVPAAGHVVTLHGPAAAANLRPRLLLTTMPEAEYVATSNRFRPLQDDSDKWVGIALEVNPEEPMKSRYFLDYVSGGMSIVGANIASMARSRDREGPKRVGVGRVATAFSYELEATPNVWPVILRGLMTQKGTTTNLGVINGKTTFERTFEVAKKVEDLASFTIVEKRGVFYFMLAGCRIDTLAVSYMDNANIMIRIAGLGVRHAVYDLDAAGGDTFANLVAGSAVEELFDANAYSFIGTEVAIDGTFARSSCFTGASFSISQGLEPISGFNKRRGISTIKTSSAMVEFSASCYFQNELEFAEALGNNSREFPFGASKKVLFKSFEMNTADWSQGEVLANINQRMRVTFPRAVVTETSIPDSGNQAIRQGLQFAPVKDAGGNTIEITIRNQMLDAEFQPVATDPITVLPVDW